MQKVIIDSDWGVDALQIAAVLLSHKESYEVVGATVTFGNAPHDQNLTNAGAILRILGKDYSIPRFPGAHSPTGQSVPPKGDLAHGINGLGGVKLPPSQCPPNEKTANEFILETLEQNPSNSVTIIAVAPLTNIANAARKAPDVFRKAKEIRIMGGCITPLKGFRVDKQLNRLSSKTIQRQGNITEHAEFNFQQAPVDTECVMNSGVPIKLFPMNCTHQMTLTTEREKHLLLAFPNTPGLGRTLVKLCSGPRKIDSQKFGISPTLHDVHTALSMVHPELYIGRNGKVTVNTDSESSHFGHSHFKADPAGSHWVAETIISSDTAFEKLLRSLKQSIPEELLNSNSQIPIHQP